MPLTPNGNVLNSFIELDILFVICFFVQLLPNNRGLGRVNSCTFPGVFQSPGQVDSQVIGVYIETSYDDWYPVFFAIVPDWKAIRLRATAPKPSPARNSSH